MISEIVAFIALLVENCTGLTLVKSYTRDCHLPEVLVTESSEVLGDFTEFDENDCIFQEFDPPFTEDADRQAWRINMPRFLTSLKDCFKTVFLIQTLCGSLIGLLTVGIEVVDFTFAEWCYEMSDQWNKMPKKVQILRVTTQAIEGALIQMWNFTCIVTVFPFALIKDLHLLTLNILGAFIDISYRLYMQLLGMYGASWKTFPLNVVFIGTIILTNYLLSRHFHPRSLKNALKLDFILSAQFVLGLPISLFAWLVVIPWYLHLDEKIKVVVASCSPLLTVVVKVVARIGAQNLPGIAHPGTTFALVSSAYVGSAQVFRVMQSDLKGFYYFVGLGVAHAVVDLIERITITMREQIWEYLYHLVRQKRRPLLRHSTPRSRRFIADVSIQIMLQEATVLVSVLGFMTVYQALYTREKPFIDHEIIMEFFKRAIAGLLIDLFFNTISLLIQTRVMNIAVCRVWKKKWCCHLVINCLICMISVTYFSEHLFEIVQDKYHHTHSRNCSYPSFL